MALIDTYTLKKRLRTNEGAYVLGHSVVRLFNLDLLIDNTPTVDAVPVVRCKDCKHWGGRHGMNECSLITTITEPTYWAKTQPDDFCSSGERRSE